MASANSFAFHISCISETDFVVSLFAVYFYPPGN